MLTDRYSYGIELETAKNFTEAQTQIIAKDFNAKIVTDGSIDGQEINSPVLKGSEVEAWVTGICRYLAEIGMTVNKKCGYHLHMSLNYAPSDTVTFLKSCLNVYKYYEPVLFAMLPPSRATSKWCLPVDLSFEEIARITNEDSIYRYYYRKKRIDAVKKKELRSTHYCEARYFNLNLHSFFYRGTIEIRAHSGTLNPLKILNWIYINTKLLELANTGGVRPETRNDFESKQASLIARLDDSLAQYVSARIKEFRPELEEKILSASETKASIATINLTRKIPLTDGSWQSITRDITFCSLDHLSCELKEFSESFSLLPKDLSVWSLNNNSIAIGDSEHIVKAINDAVIPLLTPASSYQAI